MHVFLQVLDASFDDLFPLAQRRVLPALGILHYVFLEYKSHAPIHVCCKSWIVHNRDVCFEHFFVAGSLKSFTIQLSNVIHMDDMKNLIFLSICLCPVGFTHGMVREYYDLNIGEQMCRYILCGPQLVLQILFSSLDRYSGPILIVRRTEDEMMSM